MTIIDCIKTLLHEPNADAIRLDDGATTWDVYNLLDALADGEPDARDYALQADGIYLVDEDGRLAGAAYGISVA